MSSGGRPGGGVSERHRGSDQTRKHRVAQAPGFTRRTAINLSGVLNQLTDRTVYSVDAATGAAIGPYRKSRLKTGDISPQLSIVGVITHAAQGRSLLT